MTSVSRTPLRDLVEARREDIKAVVARHQVCSVSLFGSVARGDEGPQSDIDFLVELKPGVRPFTLLVLGAELEDLLGVRVDIGRVESLRAGIRDRVLVEAVLL